jgi:hypothetical protein
MQHTVFILSLRKTKCRIFYLCSLSVFWSTLDARQGPLKGSFFLFLPIFFGTILGYLIRSQEIQKIKNYPTFDLVTLKTFSLCILCDQKTLKEQRWKMRHLVSVHSLGKTECHIFNPCSLSLVHP